MNNTQTEGTSSTPHFPRLIKVWPDWGQQAGLTRAQAYDCANKLPAGVKVKIGGRLRLNADRLADYLQAGGDLQPGNPGR